MQLLLQNFFAFGWLHFVLEFCLELFLFSFSLFCILFSFGKRIKASFFFWEVLLKILQLHFSFLNNGREFLLLRKAIQQLLVFGVAFIIFFIQIKMLHDLVENFFIVFLFLWIVAFSIFLDHFWFLAFFMDTFGSFIEFFPFLLNLIKNHLIVFTNLLLEILSVFESLMNFFIQNCLIFHFFITVLEEFLCQLLNLLNFFIELFDGVLLQRYHLLQIVTLEHQIRDGFLILGLILLTNFYQNI